MVQVTAKISAEKHPLYRGEMGPVLTAISVEPAAPAVEIPIGAAAQYTASTARSAIDISVDDE